MATKSQTPLIVNDIHSQLNRTEMSRIIAPASSGEIQHWIAEACKQKEQISGAGFRHAMGGQQFRNQGWLMDMSQMNQRVTMDEKNALATFEAGATWIDIYDALSKHFDASGRGLTFRQKQTGADRLSLGGAVGANAHGRGLNLPPMISDIESLCLIDAQGREHLCSRASNPELFSLAVGGYGLFGIVTKVTLRLVPRQKIQRVVEIIDAAQLMESFSKRIAEGFLYGDFQFRIDNEHPLFLQQGIFSCYKPIQTAASPDHDKDSLSPEDWDRLLTLAHTDKPAAFDAYSKFYLGTSGQIYWSDSHQMSVYLDGYHEKLDGRLGSATKGSEMITELYVPRASLHAFLQLSAARLRDAKANVIYGTVRLIEQDRESVLAWARESWACIIFNLHVDHSTEGINAARRQFLELIETALSFGGSYFLTYHRWANKEQTLKAHPNITRFLNSKRKYDPEEIFFSDWYEHLNNLLGMHSHA